MTNPKFEDTGITRRIREVLSLALIIADENSEYLEARGFNMSVVRKELRAAKELTK